MSNNREISQLASVLKVKESSNFIGIATEGIQTIGIGTDSISLNGTNGIISATKFVGDGSLLENVPGTDGIASSITVTDESIDTTCFPVFTTSATGNQAPKTGSNLTFNSFNGTLTVGILSANNGLNVSGGSGLVASTAKISDLNSGRVVLAGTDGELEDSNKLTFDGSTLAIVGDATFTGSVSIAGTLTKEDVTNVDSVGLVTAGKGFRATTGGLVVSSGIATFTDNIIANGNIVGDNSTNISGINSVTATSFHGSGIGLTGITASQVGAIADILSDTAPQLGGNLDINNKFITGTGGISITGVITATDFNSASDENLKENIHTIEDPLAKVVQIRGVNFDWKETQKPSVGVVAQEVEKVLPELVANGEKKTVNYNGLIGLLIEVVKEQQVQINSLNERLSRLE